MTSNDLSDFEMNQLAFGMTFRVTKNVLIRFGYGWTDGLIDGRTERDTSLLSTMHATEIDLDAGVGGGERMGIGQTEEEITHLWM